jgi:hypothetical protein
MSVVSTASQDTVIEFEVIAEQFTGFEVRAGAAAAPAAPQTASSTIIAADLNMLVRSRVNLKVMRVNGR